MSAGRAAIAAGLCMVAVASCARPRPAVELEPADTPVLLEVSNNNWHDMAIYAVRSGQRMRLGTVVAAHSANMTIAADMLGPGGEVRLVARAVGGHARYTSPRLYASPGGTVTLTLENDIRKSTVAIW